MKFFTQVGEDLAVLGDINPLGKWTGGINVDGINTTALNSHNTILKESDWFKANRVWGTN